MKTDDFYRLMKDSSELTEATLPILKTVVDEYPWFHAARLLYLKNLALTEDIRFPSELRKMAVLVPDRRKLFLLLEGEKYGLLIPQRPEETEAAPEDSFSLIDSFLSSYEKEKEPAETLLLQSSVSSDYVYWAMTNEEQGGDEKQEPEVPLQHQDLIDRFIREEEERPVGTARLVLDELPEDAPVPESVRTLNDPEGEELDDSYFTETLAQIYVRQKRYDKALQIIKTLSLNYPEKSIYFADQIRFLEKLIINTKK